MNQPRINLSVLALCCTVSACGGDASDPRADVLDQGGDPCDTNPLAAECGPPVRLLEPPEGYGACIPGGADLDGSTVVGSCWNDGGVHSVRWQRGGAAAVLDIEGNSYASAVSADGSVIVGAISPESDDDGYREDAGRRSRFDVALSDLSDDGSIMVGASFREAGNWGTAYAVRGSAGEGSLARLSPLGPGLATLVRAVSGDGRVSVGFVNDAGGVTHAAYWSEDGEPHVLESYPGESGSTATSVSRDGSVIVGAVAFDDTFTLTYPVRWTAAGVERIGEEPGYGLGVSADGRRILLQQAPPEVRQAVWEAVWEAGTAWRFDEAFAPEDFGRAPSQPLSADFAISGFTRDGRSAFGVSTLDGGSQAFVLRLPR